MSEEQDLLEINSHAHQHFDALIVSGVTERAIVVGFMVAGIERAIVAGGREQAVNWLQSLTDRARSGQMDAPKG